MIFWPEGAIAAAFVPILSTYLTKGKKELVESNKYLYELVGCNIGYFRNYIFYFHDGFGYSGFRIRKGHPAIRFTNKAYQNSSSKRPLYDAGRSNERHFKLV